MSRPSSSVDSLPLSRILAIVNEIEPQEKFTPKQWFDIAVRHAEAAKLAERRGSMASSFIAYSGVVTAYNTTISHKQYAEYKKIDSQWATRVHDFKKMRDAALEKARFYKNELRRTEDLKKEQIAPSQSSTTIRPPLPSPSLDNKPGGSIADRMKGLREHGMDTGNTAPLRISRDSVRGPVGGSGIVGSGNSNGTGNGIGGSSSHAAFASTNGTGTSRDDEQHLSTFEPQNPPPVNYRAESSRRPSSPSIPPPEQGNGWGRVSALKTGSSSHSTSGTPTVLSPANSGNGQTSSIRAPLPTRPSEQSPGTELDKFEQAFPSLSEFGKQFDTDSFGLPSVPVSGLPDTRPSDTRPPLPGPPRPFLPPSPVPQSSSPSADPEPSFPDIVFPSLPSVPTDVPGNIPSAAGQRDTGTLPSPPSRPLASFTEDIKIPSPPSPDLTSDLKRPASTPMFTDMSILSSPPMPPSNAMPIPQQVEYGRPEAARSNEPPPRPPQSLNGQGPSPLPQQRSPMSFPMAKPTTPTVVPGGRPEKGKRPEFPLTNGVSPDTLREYFLNLSIDMLLLDIRPEEEFQRGYVGAEYVSRGAKVNIVWLDPTVLMRPDLTSSKLEDAMSLSPEAQRRAFENRNTYDLVVLYDSHSVNFPRKGSPPTPTSRLWDIIHEHEFTKPLQRCPVLLVGGYEGWVDFIKQRQQRHLKQHQELSSRPYNPKPTMPNGINAAPLIPRSSTAKDLAKRANREKPVYQAAHYARDFSDTLNNNTPQSMTGSSYTNHQVLSPRQAASPMPRASHTPSSSISTYTSTPTGIAPPPRASIHPGAGTRRQSDYMDNQAYSGYGATGRSPIDYPQAHALTQVPQPPPVAASHSLERVDPRAVVRSQSTRNFDQVVPNVGVRYWLDSKLGLTGLKNLGNTCYMNSTVQCLSATLPFARYFLDGRYKRDINVYNNLGTKGNLATAFAELLGALWGENYTFLSPITFRKNIIAFKSDFAGSEQHDSQEFLSFVMDGLHEDLNRIKVKPKPVDMTPEREAQLESLPPQIASDIEWDIYKKRNDSFIVDLFQGQYMNRMECLTCHKTSTVYDSFQWLTLDLPSTKSKVVLPELFDRWVSPEILDGDEKWFCPRCKVNRRATKTLTLVRLPPVLLIQLKRFLPVNGGRFWNKSETPVIFPLTNLDLTRYVPVRKPTGAEDLDDPRTQIGPFKYDLYGVSNHMGTLSSGHYTAYVRSSDQWMFCEDSRVQPAKEQDVVSRPAYILFYKRVPVS